MPLPELLAPLEAQGAGGVCGGGHIEALSDVGRTALKIR